MAAKKPKSVDDIINDYQKFHHARGKSFEERIGKIEEFHDPKNIHAMQFGSHAHYAVFGKPDDGKKFPGAYNSAFKALHKLKDEDDNPLQDGSVIKDEDALAKILETYIDTFMDLSHGKSYKEAVKQAKEEGLDDKSLRDVKGQFFGQHYLRTKDGIINILSEDHIKKEYVGKKRIEVQQSLLAIGQATVQSYTGRLQQKAIGDLIGEDDRLAMSKYVAPKFKKQKWKHDKPHISRTANEQLDHYLALLSGNKKDALQDAGYKPIHPEKKEPKK